jgi:hypothetical protein
MSRRTTFFLFALGCWVISWLLAGLFYRPLCQLDGLVIGLPLMLCVFALPYWVITATESVRKKDRYPERRRQNQCQKCDYDLRGGHSCCPECGTPLEPSSEEISRRLEDMNETCVLLLLMGFEVVPGHGLRQIPIETRRRRASIAN